MVVENLDMDPARAMRSLARNMQDRRVQLNISQQVLSERSGVSLGTVRRFEQTGRIQLESFLMLAMVLGGIEGVVDATAPPSAVYNSIDDVIAANKRASAAPPRRRRSRRRQ